MLITDRIKALRRRLDLTQAELAARIGVSPATVSHWEIGKQTPSRLAVNQFVVLEIEAADMPDRPLSKRKYTKSRGSGHVRDLERVTIVAAAYKGGRTMEEVGAVYGITRERVRQIIVRYERESGEQIRRHRAKGRLLQTWKCRSCGAEMTGSPHERKEICVPCARDIIPRPIIEDWIAQRRAGRTWATIAGEMGHCWNGPPRSIYLFLTRHGRTTEVDELWPGGAPRWLVEFRQTNRARGRRRRDRGETST